MQGPAVPNRAVIAGLVKAYGGEWASAPSPVDGATGVSQVVTQTWCPGNGAVQHLVYWGTDEALVAAGDPSVLQGAQADASFTPAGQLDCDTTVYWRVDEVLADGGMKTGAVWSYTTAESVIPAATAVTVNYDNSAEPYVSEEALDLPPDLTACGGSVLSMRLQGRGGPQGGVVYDDATGTYEVTGAGADIWGNSDQFTFAYKELAGDGEIVAQVVSNGTGSNNWAKGGVMIRETLDANSRHMIMAMTGGEGGGITFQGRPVTGQRSNSFHGDITAAPPHWVKLTREGDTITAYHSANGTDWEMFTDASPDGAQENPIEFPTTGPIYMGLFVTSHAAGEQRTYTIDNVSAVGVADGPFTTFTTPGLVYNTAEPLYASIEDATGAIATVPHPDAGIANNTAWGLWRVDLSEFGGVDVTNAAKLYLGLGDGQPGGSGAMDFSDIRIVGAATEPDPDAVDVTAPGDVVIGQPDDGDWPGAETPDLAIDDNTGTKFLHFKGETQPSGIIVTPAMGYTVVTGLTLTTANDAVERDPVAYELYGSNLGTDGPWTLIAAGDVDDFARPIAWPRFTKNVTPIGFANTASYANYKLMFPAVRTPTSANSMQIGEVELLGVAGTEPIILGVVRANGVSGNRDPIGQYGPDTTPMPMPAGGLMDGNYVFSDRTYPWAGIPAEYVGAEYIPTFNSDKNGGNTDVTYTVTIGQPAIVWITCDDRIPAEWDSDGTITSQQDAVNRACVTTEDGVFEDTGIDIYVREKSDGSRDRPMSVFAAELDAGAYVFNSQDSGKNFYTVGAVPLQ
jgi:hypothetical protein